jgi:hypothetical protein
MSKLNRKELKELLTECIYFYNLSIINEASMKEFKRMHPGFDTSEFASQLRGNTDYLDIISNSIKASQSHNPLDYIQQFEFYKNSIERNRSNDNFLTINIPGDFPVSLVDKVNPGSCTATFDDIQQFQQARMFVLGKGSKDKLSSAYEKVLRESSSNDFELIINDSEWIVFYPKTIKGSIALARSYWNGDKVEYDRTFNPSKGSGQNTGDINWCTSVSGSGNMFLNYHRRLGMHMYYCIKKNTNVEDPSRKLCISFSKKHSRVSLMHSNASVNANNSSLSEKEFRNYIGKRVDILFSDVKKSERLEIDEKEYYESISLEQYKILRAVNEDNLDDFLNELEEILAYSKDREKILYLAVTDKSYKIRMTIAKRCKAEQSELLHDLSDDENIYVKSNCAGNQNTPAECLTKIYEYIMNPGSIDNISEENRKSVISNLLRNQNTPAEFLTKIYEYIMNPGSIDNISEENRKSVISNLLRNQNTTSKDLSNIFIYLKSKKIQQETLSWEMLRNILLLIRNKNVSEEIIKELCFHKDFRIIEIAIEYCKDSNILLKVAKSLQKQDDRSIILAKKIIRNKSFNEEIQKVILNKIDLKEISQDLLSTKTIDSKMILSIFNDIVKSLDERDNFVTLSLIATNTKTPIPLRKKISKTYNFAKAVFNNFDADLTFEEFFDKYKNLNIDFSELEMSLKNNDEIKLNKYLYNEYELLEITQCKASKENPREMYLFLKERGIDISKKIFFEYLLEDPYAWGYERVELVTEDPDNYHPWLKELLNISENINESNNIKSISEYIRLFIS